MEGQQTSSLASVRVAFEGCGHGCLNDIYASVENAATLKGWDGVDLVVIGGDFQAIRNANDLTCMSVPLKYREMGDFHEYYSGKRTAPYLTVFIGGNHEAGNHLFELYYGGWVAPNIYYLGAANVLRFGPLRIAGMSGIWKGYDYRKPHFERLPYNRDDISSIYHVREIDVRKLLQVRTQVDLGLSHDWPKQVELCGDSEYLFRTKRGFREDSDSGKLGNPAAKYVLDRLRPAHWFSAHLHVKFAAIVAHGEYVIPGHPGAKRKAEAPQPDPTPASGAPHQFGLDGAILGVLALPDDDQETERTLPARSATEQEPSDEHESAGPATQPSDVDKAKEVPSKEENPSDPSDTQSKISAWNNFHAVAAEAEAAENSRYLADQSLQFEIDEDGARRVNTGDGANKKLKTEHNSEPVKNADEINLDLDSESDAEAAADKVPTSEPERTDGPSSNQAASSDDAKSTMPTETASGTDISEDLRNQLPASFARPQPDPFPLNGPLPEAIINKTTNFLALDKCLPQRHFLQLLEIEAISEQEGVKAERPYRLQYDKEWLAITRAFANDLQLGDPAAKPPADKGDQVYKPLIEEEERWVDEHVVKPGKLDVPENFTLTAPVYDPAVPLDTEEQPIEYTNPQTAQFCELVGIENKFHMSDEERRARMAAGPRPSDFRPRDRGPRRGGFGRGRGGGGRGRGGRGGRGGGGGGRGRGRGYQHY
ncbi:RNA lariat debranching enzyme [Aspergillus saccharolyticus JOP 1030-1]|uniref:DBR1-domain-containing protein n=1 Tax=Aspergillus saccharolyticus JOP 1030-1 TaxID=1450539 RepID=A0A318ZZJ3_9EURO|nr:DBR1-domain-containing protein [Aspergillus saccharolyticus JOP 1030-1]PYH49703.1 DBR1-domain-containing protein [Aspergillus saccharolyticus JOP 1030-1]